MVAVSPVFARTAAAAASEDERLLYAYGLIDPVCTLPDVNLLLPLSELKPVFAEFVLFAAPDVFTE